MSIIAVKGVPPRWSLLYVVKALAKAIKGQFEALNFDSKYRDSLKTCYLRLSEKLDPQQVVERINNAKIDKRANLTAFIPNRVPDLPLAKKPVKVPFKMRTKLRIVNEQSPEDVFVKTHNEIMIELQCKYSDLFNLSRKSGHKLLESVARTIFERLEKIIDLNSEYLENCFILSKMYRKMHPHFGDFQMLLSSLHRLQDAAGAPRSQLNERELMSVPLHPFAIKNIPIDKVNEACNKYSNKIVKVVSEHIKNLKTDENPENETEEEKARRRVREELKKISPFLNMMVKQVIQTHLIPEKTPFHKIRIYGEPFMPTKDLMAPFLRRFGAVRVRRSERIFNLLTFNIPPALFPKLIEQDGTVIGGAKLVIRSFFSPLYKIPVSLIAEMKMLFGVTHTEPEGQDDMYEMEDDGGEGEEEEEVNWQEEL